MMTTPTADYPAHRFRGWFNAAFFTAFDGYLDHLLGPHKRRVFADLPDTVAELGSGSGANLRYLRPGQRLVAIEPNPAMHRRLIRRAAAAGVDLSLHDVMAERVDLPDGSVPMVISSLVLCTVRDPEVVLAEVERILAPGGRYAFVEHVVAPAGGVTRSLQAGLRRPWAWTFEGCSCERDLGALIGDRFEEVDLDGYRIRSPFVPFNTQVAGVAKRR